MSLSVHYMPPGTKVTITSAALAEKEGYLVLRGVVDPASFSHLQVDDYQREVLAGAKVKGLKEALKNGGVPDIILGMRGETCDELMAGKRPTGTFILKDPVFIIDGLQRTNAAIELYLKDPAHPPVLGATIYFSTTKEWEREMFRQYNANQTRVNGNVLLNTMWQEDVFTAIGMLYSLVYVHDPKDETGSNEVTATFLERLSETRQDDIVLRGRVSWKQRLAKTDLLTAVTYVKTAGMLHSHTGPGKSNNVVQLATGLEKIVANVGLENFALNVMCFFDVVDRTFGVRDLDSRDHAPWLNTMFLLQLARVFSEHQNFWREEGRQLFVTSDTITKIGRFKFDRAVTGLVSQGGSANDILYNMLVAHINSGRTTNRLVKWDELVVKPDVVRSAMAEEPEVVDEESEAEAA